MLVDKFGTLSSEDLEKLIAPNADCLKLVPTCHLDAGIELVYFRETKSLGGYCNACKSPVVAITVGDKK